MGKQASVIGPDAAENVFRWTDFAFAGWERVAAVPGSDVSTVYFLTKDQVGTTRVVTDEHANTLANCNQNANYHGGSMLTCSPFGTRMDCQQSATGYLFTGKMQDAESNLARFDSPDARRPTPTRRERRPSARTIRIARIAAPAQTTPWRNSRSTAASPSLRRSPAGAPSYFPLGAASGGGALATTGVTP